MKAAFAYYLVCSLRNRVISRLRRLRQPKYFLSLLVGIAYLYFVFFRRLSLQSSVAPARPVPLDMDFLPLLETGFALLLLATTLIPWVFNTRAEGLSFTEPEIQFLFPAPISRRALLHFRILKGQTGILFGVLVTVLLFGRGGSFAHPVFLTITLWIVYSFLSFYRIGTSLSKLSLASHGISGLKHQFGAIALVAILIVAIAVWLRWFIPLPPSVEDATPSSMLAWLRDVFNAGPAYYFLFPFRCLVRPAFSRSGGEFLLRVLPALGFLYLAYLWIVRSDVSFEEASLERAKKTASRLAAAKRGGLDAVYPRSGRPRRPPFRLAPRGRPHVAVFWKNLISASRINLRRFIPVVVLIFAAIIISSVGEDPNRTLVPGIIGMTAAMMALFFIFMGPVIVRDDLRMDLLQADLLKTYPMPGWSVVLGEVMAPAAVLAVLEWCLLLVAGFMMPPLAEVPFTPVHRLLFGVTAAIVIPCITLVGVVMQNAAVLIMPGWMQLGKEHHRGIEAMGQRLITMMATLLLMVVAGVPSALGFLIVFVGGYWVVGLWFLPVAALAASLILLAETAAAVVWLGGLFERLDVSQELSLS